MQQAAEVVQLDTDSAVFGVCSVQADEHPSWVIFTGQDAGRRAWAYASETYSDVKTGRLAPPRTTGTVRPFERKAG